jgi:hypothetical protein
MKETGKVSRCISESPIYGYLNRSMLASTRLCNNSTLDEHKLHLQPSLGWRASYQKAVQLRVNIANSRVIWTVLVAAAACTRCAIQILLTR